jgi:hypothetical protein
MALARYKLERKMAELESAAVVLANEVTLCKPRTPLDTFGRLNHEFK